LLVSFFELWLLKERFTTGKALGLLLGVIGSVFLVLQKESGQHASNYLLGDLLLLLNATFYAFYLIAVKPLMEKYSPLHVIRWIFTISLPLILPIGWGEMESVRWSAFDLNYFIVLAAIVITGSFLAYYFTAYGLQHLSPSITGSYIYTQPVFAVLIAVLFLNESFTWQKALSALLIFAGVYLVSFRKRNRNGASI
jgi:drug/metabolite transporter (DMT)-like permease